MISSGDYRSWVKQAYPNVAFYNFEHPEGDGVILTIDSSTPQVFLVDGKIMENLGDDIRILVSDEEVKALSEKFWGKPKVNFPEIKIKQPNLTCKLGIEEILELKCDPEKTKRTISGSVYIVKNEKIKLGKHGIQIGRTYYPYSSITQIENRLKSLVLD